MAEERRRVCGRRERLALHGRIAYWTPNVDGNRYSDRLKHGKPIGSLTEGDF